MAPARGTPAATTLVDNSVDNNPSWDSFFVRELVEDKTIRVPFVPTADNLADFFTKAKTGKPFRQLRDKIMGILPGDAAGSQHGGALSAAAQSRE